MPGHAEAVVSLQFSPDNQHLASGSGDTTLRLWDLNTETPHFTCIGHRQWVLCVSWSPDSEKIATACKAGEIRIWDPNSGKQFGNKPLVGHKKWINCLSWEPYHQNPECRHLASAGSDGDTRIWDVTLQQCVKVLAGHTAAVTAVRWGGAGLIYTSSKDRTIKMWRSDDGVLCRTMTGHAHWVNNLTLNTDYILRTGPFHPVMDKIKAFSQYQSKFLLFYILILYTNKFLYISFVEEELKQMAMERYRKVCPNNIESLVSCSDDFTLYLWRSDQSKHIARMTGHQNVVNDVKYSPDVK